MERRKRVVPREVCVIGYERSNHRTRKRGGAEHAEVSRGHSSWGGQSVPTAKDRINRSLEYDRERRNDQQWQKTWRTMAVRR
jgi:hypothetical protein